MAAEDHTTQRLRRGASARNLEHHGGRHEDEHEPEPVHPPVPPPTHPVPVPVPVHRPVPVPVPQHMPAPAHVPQHHMMENHGGHKYPDYGYMESPPKQPDYPPKQPDYPPKQPDYPPKQPDYPPKAEHGYEKPRSYNAPDPDPYDPYYYPPNPTERPTPVPTPRPTYKPTPYPTFHPTPRPTHRPTPDPTPKPTPNPTKSPTKYPSASPTEQPSAHPTTPLPSASPTKDPSPAPSPEPSAGPSPAPSPEPSPAPSPEPSAEPTVSHAPTPFSESPTRSREPSENPTNSEEPSENPTQSEEPSENPTQSEEPSDFPTQSEEPSDFPTISEAPSFFPTISEEPTFDPTIANIVCTTPRFSLLCRALRLTGLDQLLNNGDLTRRKLQTILLDVGVEVFPLYTLFAPNNAAFRDLLVREINDLWLRQDEVVVTYFSSTRFNEIFITGYTVETFLFSEEIVEAELILSEILLTHVLTGEFRFRELTCGSEYIMANAARTKTICTNRGIGADGTTLGWNKFQVGRGNDTGDAPLIITRNIEASNGIIHEVDEVILPLFVIIDPPIVTTEDPTGSPTGGPTTVDDTLPPSSGDTPIVFLPGEVVYEEEP